MGWVHPDAIRLWLFIERTQYPFHSDSLEKTEDIEAGDVKASGQPTWKLFFQENLQ
jgi:hypothetical protein